MSRTIPFLFFFLYDSTLYITDTMIKRLGDMNSKKAAHNILILWTFTARGLARTTKTKTSVPRKGLCSCYMCRRHWPTGPGNAYSVLSSHQPQPFPSKCIISSINNQRCNQLYTKVAHHLVYILWCTNKSCRLFLFLKTSNFHSQE